MIAAYPVQIPLACLFAFWLNMGVSGLWWGDVCGMVTQMTMFFCLVCIADWEKITRKAVERIELESKILKENEEKRKEKIEARISGEG